MFGLGNIFGSGLFGKFFDSIGLGWMGNVLSLATNVMTGNWLAAAKDVFGLVSQFSNNNSWMSRVSQFQPLGEFATDGCFGGGRMSETRAADLRIQADSDEARGLANYSRTIYTVHDTVQNNVTANAYLRQAQMNRPA